MAISDEAYQLMMKYLDDELSEEEQLQFENLMEESAEFRQEVKHVDAVAATIFAQQKSSDIAEISAVFDEFEKEDNVPLSGQRKVNRLVYAVAAGISVLLVATFLLFLRPSNVSPDQLFAENYQSLPINVSSRNASELPEALELYRKGRYSAAIPLLEVLADDPGQRQSVIYLSNALLETGATEEAINTLKDLQVADNEVFLKQYRHWYLGMAYLKNNELALSRAQFEQLLKEGGIYREEARKLIEAMNQLDD